MDYSEIIINKYSMSVSGDSYTCSYSLRKADVVVGCHSPGEGLEDGAAVSVTEAWILGMYYSCSHSY